MNPQEEHTMKIINIEKKKMVSLTNEREEYHEKTKIYNICKKQFELKCTNHKNYRKVKDHCSYRGKYRGAAARSVYNLKYSVPEEINAVLQNGSSYAYHFIIKELTKEFRGEFICVGENSGKNKIFSGPITKEVKRMDKNEEEITKIISSKLQFDDSARFMTSSLSNLLGNLVESNS